MIEQKIDVKLKKVLALNGKSAQVDQALYVPPELLKEWERLEQEYFKNKQQ